MSGDRDRPVVVGYDGSPSSCAALDEAAAEALSLGLPLHIVHAYPWPIFYATLANVPFRPGEWEPPPAVRAQLDAAAARLIGRHGGLAVRTLVMAGTGGPVLVDASVGAALVVVGGRGIGGITGVLTGSVASYVASHAHCPVLVVRAAQSALPEDGPVVVGVDGSASSLAALRFACEWAARRGAAVEVITAEAAATPTGRARLSTLAGSVRREHPSVAIRSSLVEGAASSALLVASRSARLVVVGSRNLSGVASLVHGSVGHDLIRHSACPVAVVHDGAPSSGRNADDLVGRNTGAPRPT